MNDENNTNIENNYEQQYNGNELNPQINSTNLYQEQNAYENEQNNQIQTNDEIIELGEKIDPNDYLLQCYIGDNYYPITNNIYNISAGFFGGLYLFYRKLYLYGIIIFLIDFVSISIFKLYFIPVILRIVMLFSFNKLYIYWSKKKIEQIKQQNSSENPSMIKNQCRVNGGINSKGILIGIITDIGLIVVLVALCVFVRISVSIFSYSFGDYRNNSDEIKTVYDTSITMKDEFLIDLPESFVDESEKYDYQFYYSSNNNVYESCSFHMYAVEKYNNSQELLKRIEKSSKAEETTAISEKMINGIEWYTFSEMNYYAKKTYYSTKKNDIVYVIEIIKSNDAPTNCEHYQNVILNSIKKNRNT